MLFNKRSIPNTAHSLSRLALLAGGLLLSTLSAPLPLGTACAADLQNHGGWDQFPFPEVVVVDKDNGSSTGSQLVKRLIPDLPAFLREIALGVCQTLYKDVGEVPAFQRLTFELEYYDGVAYKAGNPPYITINLSTKYLEGQYNSMGDEAITYEIAGITWHELTHAYQYNPRNCGGYQGGTEFFGFIEGAADGVRIIAGYHKTRSPSQGGSWTDGYTTTGFFIQWLQQSRDPDFLYKLNQSCKTVDPWSYDKACNGILGQGVSSLWSGYQQWLPNRGKEAQARFNANATLICKGQSVSFVNSSGNSPSSYRWSFEGGSSATSSEASPSVTYETAGIYPVSLTATNQYGTTISRNERYITVLDLPGRIELLTRANGPISHPDITTPEGEGVANLIDGSIATKYCILQKQTWVQYDVGSDQPLYAYGLTSANDESGRDPAEWTVEGSSDGYGWEVIDRRQNERFLKRYQTNLYFIDQPAGYRYYRFSLSARTDQKFQIAELTMYGLSASTAVRHCGASAIRAGGAALRLAGQSDRPVFRIEAAGYDQAAVSVFNTRGELLMQERITLSGGRAVSSRGFRAAPGTYVVVAQLSRNGGSPLTVRRQFQLLGN